MSFHADMSLNDMLAHVARMSLPELIEDKDIVSISMGRDADRNSESVDAFVERIADLFP